MLQPGHSSLTLLSVGRKPRLARTSLVLTLCAPSQSDWCMGHSLLKNPTATAGPTQQLVGQHMAQQGC